MTQFKRIPNRLMITYEYTVSPVRAVDDINYFEPDELPLSLETIAQLSAWDVAFQATYQQDDPLASGFPDEKAEERWKKEGVKIWQQIQNELGSEYEVFYKLHHNGRRYVLKNSSELPDDLKVD